jgi:hypothetical protein
MIDIKGFKKVSENNTHAVLEHPQGHRITVSKKALKKPMLKKLSEIPLKMADGGEVPDTDNPEVISRLPDTRNIEPEKPLFGNFASDDYASNPSPQVAGASPDAPAPAPSPQQATPAAPMNYPISQAREPASPAMSPTAGVMSGITKGIGMQEKGIKAEANAAGEMAGKQAEAATEQQGNLEKLRQDHEQHYNALNQEIQNTVHDIQNSHIDPSHYMSSKSTLGKVSTAIGLILGGMGGGMTGQKNPALEFLNSQIERDVEAQKAELGKKENVLGAYYKQMGNLNEATNMTKAFYHELYANRLAQAAAQSGSAVAQARAQQGIGQLEASKAQIIAPMALRSAAEVNLKNGNGAALEYLPEEMRARVVQLPGGKYSLAPTKEDAEGTRKSLTSLQAVMKQVQDYKNFQNQTGRTAPYSDNDYRGDSIKNSIVLELNKLHDLNRLNDNEYHAFQSMLSHPGSINQGKATVQIDQIQKLIQDKMQAELQNHLQGYKAPYDAPKNNKVTGSYAKR